MIYEVQADVRPMQNFFSFSGLNDELRISKDGFQSNRIADLGDRMRVIHAIAE